MTKEHLNEIMASLCKKLMIDKSDLVAIHEAALVALGIALEGCELKEYSLAADGELWGLARDLDFLVLNVDEFRAGLKAGNEFACDVDRDGVVLYGTV